MRGAVSAAVAAGKKSATGGGAGGGEKNRRERGLRWGDARKKKKGTERPSPADRGKEAEQRKSIVRLLIEKWGRFMGYRQTELSPSLSRPRGRLAPSPRVRDRPADIASLSPSIPFASRLPPPLRPARLAPSRRRAFPRARARARGPDLFSSDSRPPPFSLPVGLLSSLRLFMDLPRCPIVSPPPRAFSFTFSLPDAGEKVRALAPFFSRRSRH